MTKQRYKVTATIIVSAEDKVTASNKVATLIDARYSHWTIDEVSVFNVSEEG